jgi:hypothetical protein
MSPEEFLTRYGQQWQTLLAALQGSGELLVALGAFRPDEARPLLAQLDAALDRVPPWVIYRQYGRRPKGGERYSVWKTGETGQRVPVKVAGPLSFVEANERRADLTQRTRVYHTVVQEGSREEAELATRAALAGVGDLVVPAERARILLSLREGPREGLPAVGARVRLVAHIDRYPLMGYDHVGNAGVVTLSTAVALWVKMDGPPIARLDQGWDNQIVLQEEALSGEGNEGSEIASMAALFDLFFEVLPDEGKE